MLNMRVLFSLLSLFAFGCFLLPPIALAQENSRTWTTAEIIAEVQERDIPGCALPSDLSVDASGQVFVGGETLETFYPAPLSGRVRDEKAQSYFTQITADPSLCARVGVPINDPLGDPDNVNGFPLTLFGDDQRAWPMTHGTHFSYWGEFINEEWVVTNDVQAALIAHHRGTGTLRPDSFRLDWQLRTYAQEAWDGGRAVATYVYDPSNSGSFARLFGSIVEVNTYDAFIRLPWAARVRTRVNPRQSRTCGGALIEPEWVLTVAHCVLDDARNVVPATDVTVTLGEAFVNDPNGLAYNVTEVHSYDGAWAVDWIGAMTDPMLHPELGALRTLGDELSLRVREELKDESKNGRLHLVQQTLDNIRDEATRIRSQRPSALGIPETTQEQAAWNQADRVLGALASFTNQQLVKIVEFAAITKDLALLRVTPVGHSLPNETALPPLASLHPESTAGPDVAIGWGNNAEYHKVAPIRTVRRTLNAFMDCRPDLPSDRFAALVITMVCYRNLTAPVISPGDSGGPIAFYDGQGGLSIFSLNSWGRDNRGVGVGPLVSLHRGWIADTIIQAQLPEPKHRFVFEGSVENLGRDGTNAVTSNTRYVSDRFGIPQAAVAFDGKSDGKVALPVGLLEEPMGTLTLWFRLPNESGVLLDRGGEVPFRVSFDTETDRLRIALAGETLFSGVVIPNNWYHLALVWDGADWNLFLNGLARETGVATRSFASSAQVTLGAASDGADAWHGRVDDLAVYDVVLTGSNLEAAVLPASAPASGPSIDAILALASRDFLAPERGIDPDLPLIGPEKTDDFHPDFPMLVQPQNGWNYSYDIVTLPAGSQFALSFLVFDAEGQPVPDGTAYSVEWLDDAGNLVAEENGTVWQERISLYRLETEVKQLTAYLIIDSQAIANYRVVWDGETTGSLAVTSRFPEDGATDVSLDTSLQIWFTGQVAGWRFQHDPGLLTLRDPQGREVPLHMPDLSGQTYVATTDHRLEPATTYEARLRGGAAGIRSTDGNTLSADVVWSFTTADVPYLTVTPTSPVDRATGVSVSTALSLDFSVAVSESALANHLTLTDSFGQALPLTVLPGSDGKRHLVSIQGNLAYETTYTARVAGGPLGLRSQNEPSRHMAGDAVWTFTTMTQPPVDTIPPTPVIEAPWQTDDPTITVIIRGLDNRGITGYRFVEDNASPPSPSYDPDWTAIINPPNPDFTLTFTHTLQLGIPGEQVRRELFLWVRDAAGQVAMTSFVVYLDTPANSAFDPTVFDPAVFR